ncbi:MAG TPA: hypothetical protein DCR93_27225 [Cytophagales bacterium]|nr:hypothetical protein [Cytophagales bacterium]HAP63034.1 hypothetical protein [Cytophagales bacterium]
MKKIELQKKTTAKNGKIEIYYFENENIGLKKTLLHRIYIPLEPFDSGLECESQPLETEIVMEWLNLKLKEPTELAGLKLSSNPEDEIEVSIYVGSAHNPCDIKEMEFQKTGDNKYKVKCSLLVDFEHEGVAENEEYNFNTELNLDKEIKE